MLKLVDYLFQLNQVAKPEALLLPEEFATSLKSASISDLT